MSIIYTYPVTAPAAGDLVLMSDVSTSKNATKSATVQSLIDLVPADTLAEVLTAGNTATNNINLTGNIALTGNLTGSGNITRTGNITLTGAQTISTTLGVTGTTTLGVLSLSSISGGWTNAGNTIADLGTVTTVDINGGNIDGTIIGNGTPAVGTFTTLIGTTIDGAVGSVTPTTGAFTTLTSTFIDGIIGSISPAAGTFTTITGSGNLAIDIDTLFVDAATDRVGIGIANPDKKLHLYGASGEVELRIQSDTSFCSIVQKDNNEMIIQNAASGGVMIFHDDSAERMRIDTNGNVGIGINNPTTTLYQELQLLLMNLI